MPAVGLRAPSAFWYDDRATIPSSERRPKALKPVNIGGHAAYRNALRKRLRVCYPNFKVISESQRRIYKKFRDLDLSPVDSIMEDKYSVFGPEPRLPSCMFRSFLLSLAFHIPGVTAWVEAMRVTPLYAILSGFAPDDTPGVGTFYDFFDRLWDSPAKNLTNHVQFPRLKVKKPKNKGEKADSVEKETTEELIERLSLTDFFLDEQPYATLFSIFQACFLNQSVLRGVLSPENLTLSGDGTPVVTSARERSHKICACGKARCSCPRFFSQPDCDIGWDSSRNLYYSGYDLYLITDTKRDLPLFPLFHPASKHDSHGFCEAFFRFLSFLPDFKPSRLTLDSAHDVTAIYTLCQSLRVVPFIDLNPRNAKKPSAQSAAIETGPDGVPVCSAGLKMKPNGADLKRRYVKFRCPLMSKGKCRCDAPCSSAKFGRTFSVAMKTNPRLYNFPPRESREWKKTYNARTASERANKRIKNDYHLEDGHHRSTRMWYVRLYAIVMSLHLDAWPVS